MKRNKYRFIRQCMLTITCAFVLGDVAHAQYLHDFQDIVVAPNASQTNSTLTKTDDGGYFSATSLTVSSNTAQIMCYKLNPDLSVAWSAVLDYPSSVANITVTDVKQCKDKGYILCGKVIDEGSFTSGYLMKIDAAANMVWFKHYTDAIVAGLNSVVETPKGFISVGYAGSISYGDGIILCTDNLGQTIWSQRVLATQQYGVTNLTQIIATSDNTFATIGYTNLLYNLAATYESDAVVLHFDINGNILGNWVYGNQWNYGATADEEGAAIKYNPADNSFILLGKAEMGAVNTCSTQQYNDVWVWKTDASNGSIIWSNRYNLMNANVPGYAQDKAWVTDLDFDDTQIGITGAHMNLIAPNTYHLNTFIARMDPAGNLFNSRLYPDNEDNSLARLIRTDHQSYVAGGQTMAIGAVNQLNLVESYDNIIEVCNMEYPDYLQTPFNVNIIQAVLTPEKPAYYDFKLTPDKYPYKENIICERKYLGTDAGAKKALPNTNTTVFTCNMIDGNTILLNVDNSTPVPVSVINALGQTVGTYNVQGQQTISLSLAPGIYVVKSTVQDKVYATKIVISK